MKIEFSEKKLKKLIEKNMKKKYKKTLKNSRQLNLLFNGAFKILNENDFKDLNVKEGLNNSKEEIKVVLSFVTDYFKGKYREVKPTTIMTLGFGIFYLVEPIDLISDFLPIMGFSDDLSVLSYIIVLCHDEIKLYKEFLKANIEDIKYELANFHQNTQLINIETQDINVINDVLVDIEEHAISELAKNLEAIKATNYLCNEGIEIKNEILEIDLNKIEQKQQVNIEEVALEEFFTYNHMDYSRIIHQIIYYNDEELCEITSDMIKNKTIDKDYFNYQTCVETMINNQCFDLLEKKSNITKPYTRILESDKKQSLTGSYYVVKYEKNPEISDSFEQLYNWNLEENIDIDSNTKLIQYNLYDQEEFNKMQIESLIETVKQFYYFINGNIVFKLFVENDMIKITVDNRNKGKCRIDSGIDLYKKYNQVFDYLEDNLIKIIENADVEEQVSVVSKKPKLMGKLNIKNIKGE